MHNISTQRSVSWHLPQRYLCSRKQQVNAYYSGLLGPASFVNNEINQVLQGVFWGPEFGSWLWKFRESTWGVAWTPGSSTGQTDGGTLEDLTFRSMVPTGLLHFVREVSVLCQQNGLDDSSQSSPRHWIRAAIYVFLNFTFVDWMMGKSLISVFHYACYPLMQENRGIKILESHVFIEIQIYPLALCLYVPPKLTFFLQISLSCVNIMKNISYTQMILA